MDTLMTAAAQLVNAIHIMDTAVAASLPHGLSETEYQKQVTRSSYRHYCRGV